MTDQAAIHFEGKLDRHATNTQHTCLNRHPTYEVGFVLPGAIPI
jgi:hypothetical protein